jgi:ATP synthase subunit 6
MYALIPYGFAITSHFIWTIYFSISICLGIFLIGILNYKVKFFKIFLPKVPLVLLPLMLTIEVVSYIIRSLSLAIRLSANIMAGHTLTHIIADVVYYLFSFVNYFEIFSFLLIILLSGIIILELGVAFLQAYVFTLLICMYLNDSINFEGH